MDPNTQNSFTYPSVGGTPTGIGMLDESAKAQAQQSSQQQSAQPDDNSQPVGSLTPSFGDAQAVEEKEFEVEKPLDLESQLANLKTIEDRDPSTVVTNPEIPPVVGLKAKVEAIENSSNVSSVDGGEKKLSPLQKLAKKLSNIGIIENPDKSSNGATQPNIKETVVGTPPLDAVQTNKATDQPVDIPENLVETPKQDVVTPVGSLDQGTTQPIGSLIHDTTQSVEALEQDASKSVNTLEQDLATPVDSHKQDLPEMNIETHKQDSNITGIKDNFGKPVDSPLNIQFDAESMNVHDNRMDKPPASGETVDSSLDQIENSSLNSDINVPNRVDSLVNDVINSGISMVSESTVDPTLTNVNSGRDVNLTPDANLPTEVNSVMDANLTIEPNLTSELNSSTDANLTTDVDPSMGSTLVNSSPTELNSPVPTSTYLPAELNSPMPASTNSLEEQNSEPLLGPTVEEIASESASSSTVKLNARYPYTIEQLMDIVVERESSDLHITVGYPAMIRIDGELITVCDEIVSAQNAVDLIMPVLPEQKKELLEVNREVDLAYSHHEDARFRINAYYQQETLAGAFRLIPNRIRSIEELNLPQIYHQIAKLRQGFVLVTGPTGSGKSTTLASIIQEINMNRGEHIITIEDPVEYVFPKSRAMVDQRELHEDTHSWEIALKSALRQDPDVMLVGEMRDFETIAAAITLAETGHLVFATLHTNNAAQTIDRIIDVFPEHQQSQVRSQLSNTIEAVIAQRLIPITKGGRRAVSEIMLATPAIRNLIREAKTHQIDNVIRTSADIGMISLEHSLVKLVRDNVITMERAQEYAVHPEEITRLLKS